MNSPGPPASQTARIFEMRETSVVLNAALKCLSEQYSDNLPDEVTQLFPRWKQEMPDIICTANKSQIFAVLQRLEREVAKDASSAVGCAFARSALQAALDTHDAYGPTSYNGSPTPHSAYVQRAASETEAELLLPRVMAGAPPSMREFFPDFEDELRAALTRPLADLRAAAARLEATLADHEVRCFTEQGMQDGGDELLHEADALAFAVRGIHEVVHAKSTAAIAAAVASAVAAAINAGLPIITSTRDGHSGRPDPQGRQPPVFSSTPMVGRSEVRGAPSASDASSEHHTTHPPQPAPPHQVTFLLNSPHPDQHPRPAPRLPCPR